MTYKESRLFLEIERWQAGGGTPTCETCKYWEDQGGWFSSSKVCTNARSSYYNQQRGKDHTCDRHESR